MVAPRASGARLARVAHVQATNLRAWAEVNRRITRPLSGPRTKVKVTEKPSPRVHSRETEKILSQIDLRASHAPHEALGSVATSNEFCLAHDLSTPLVSHMPGPGGSRCRFVDSDR